MELDFGNWLECEFGNYCGKGYFLVAAADRDFRSLVLVLVVDGLAVGQREGIAEGQGHQIRQIHQIQEEGQNLDLV